MNTGFGERDRNRTYRLLVQSPILSITEFWEILIDSTWSEIKEMGGTHPNQLRLSVLGDFDSYRFFYTALRLEPPPPLVPNQVPDTIGVCKILWIPNHCG